MAGRTTDGFSSFKGFKASSQMTTGTVRAYDPRTAIYKVKLDSDQSVKYARALSNGGVMTAYADNAAVVIIQCGVAGWFIFAEYVRPQPNYDTVAPNFNPRTIQAEQTAFGAFSTADYRFGSGQANFREVDSDGQVSESVFQGETKLVNKQERHAEESFVAIKDFGDILIEASKMAFIWLSKKTEKALIKCRDIEFRAVGYNLKTSCPTIAPEGSSEKINKVTVVEEIYPDALKLGSGDRCYEFVSGFQSNIVGTLVKLGTLLSFNADNTNKKVSVVLGETKKVSIQFDESNDSIRISKAGQLVEMTPTTLAFTHKGQYIKLTDAGLEITAKAIRINSTEQTTIDSSGPITVLGTTVSIN